MRGREAARLHADPSLAQTSDAPVSVACHTQTLSGELSVVEALGSGNMKTRRVEL